MCGICGWISKREVDEAELGRMNDMMVHRGPDDAGVKVLREHGKQIGLAQRRLAIQDLSELGHQPMCSADGTVWIVFNGEIYNFKELKQELTGYPFRSECDTEVILAMYQAEGIDCIRRMNGMFAISIYDIAEDVCYLVRDRLGQKPLYYYKSDDDFIFASELKPIMESSAFHKKINEQVLKRYLFHGYIKGPDSIFQDVSKVRPGTYLEYRGGEITEHVYWNLPEVYDRYVKQPILDYDTAKSQLTEKLKQAVAYRMIADVPVGSFLSGGYDSSLITAMAQQVSSEPIRTYCIGFQEKKYDEAIYARQVAEYLGTNHTEYYISEDDILNLVQDLPKYYDEPFADSSQIPSMLVANLAAQDVKVVLSGDGGDEFFCGYDFYEIVRKAQSLAPVTDIMRKIFKAAPSLLSLCMPHMPEFLTGILLNEEERFKTQFFDGSRRDLCDKIMGNRRDIAFEEEFGLLHISDWQIRRMLLDMTTYLPADILCKVDRATMKDSLEARCPILDKDVVECSFMIPHNFKYHKNNPADGKYILKQIAYDYIPESLLKRPKKGFSVPLNKWLHGPLSEALLDYTSESFLKKQNLFQAEQLQSVVRQFLNTPEEKTGHLSRTIWNLFVLQQWYDMYMK